MAEEKKKKHTEVEILLRVQVHDTAFCLREDIASGTINKKEYDVSLGIPNGALILNLHEPENSNKWKTVIVPAMEYTKAMLKALGEEVD